MKEENVIKKYYNQDPQKEWDRLDGFKYEFEITKNMFGKYLKRGKILDIGGGAGRYSLYLAELGYDVTLVDLSENNVSFALEKAKESGLKINAFQADAKNLDKLNLGEFDSILLMGPLYHLSSEEDRNKCVSEAKKHLKQGGIIFASFLSLNSMLNYCLDKELDALIMDEDTGLLDCMVNDKTWTGDAFTRVTFVDSDSIEPFFTKCGFRKISIFGQEGITARSLQVLESAPDKIRDFYLDLSLRLCEKPKYWTYSSHLMYVGEKCL